MATGSLTTALLALLIGTLPPDVVAMKSLHFRIPISIKEGGRDKIKELLLYSSADEGKTWTQVGTATPDKEAFIFHAPSDGLYWFSICVIDTQGKQQPPDIYKVPPGQKILVDTIKPVIRITTAERQGDDVLVAWEIQESYPDFSKLKLEYKSADAPAWSWTSAQVSQAMAGQSRIRLLNNGPVQVKLEIADLAGNIGMAQTEIVARVAAAPSNPAVIPTSASNMTTVPAVSTMPNAGTPPVPQMNAFNAPATRTEQPQTSTTLSNPPPSNPWMNPANGSSAVGTVQAAPITNIRAPAPPWDASAGVQSTSLRQAQPAGSPNPSTMSLASEATARAPSNTGTLTNTSWNSPPSAQSWATQSPAGVQVTNTTQVAVNYEVKNLGASGVGSVELYLTQDDGQTWHRFAEDARRTPPMTVSLPSEGIFGLRIVVGSGAGLGRRPPKPGDLPQMRVDVDLTPPAVKVYMPKPDPRRREALILNWTASDRNLGPNPITLQWAERPEPNGWQTIAADLPNSTGSYTWTMPQTMPSRVYFRVLAKDLAGNVGIDETPEPVLIDFHEPEAQITSVVPVGGRQ